LILYVLTHRFTELVRKVGLGYQTSALNELPLRLAIGSQDFAERAF
jgi:hypothetical protein